MDIQPRRPQQGNPNRAGHGNAPRPLVTDFTPRRPMVNAPPSRPVRSAVPTPASVAPASPTTAPTPHAPQHAPVSTRDETSFEPPQLPKLDKPKEPKRRSPSGHAGLVGLVVFLVLSALLLSSLLPGKVLDDFPGSSASSSNGDQSFACITDIQDSTSATTYTTKLGAPLVYKSATSTTLTGTCNGKTQTVIGGTTTQFSPLAALINIALAAVVAFVVTALWRKIFGSHD